MWRSCALVSCLALITGVRGFGVGLAPVKALRLHVNSNNYRQGYNSMSATRDSSAAERRRCNSAAKGSLRMLYGEFAGETDVLLTIMFAM